MLLVLRGLALPLEDGAVLGVDGSFCTLLNRLGASKAGEDADMAAISCSRMLRTSFFLDCLELTRGDDLSSSSLGLDSSASVVRLWWRGMSSLVDFFLALCNGFLLIFLGCRSEKLGVGCVPAAREHLFRDDSDSLCCSSSSSIFVGGSLGEFISSRTSSKSSRNKKLLVDPHSPFLNSG